MFKHAGLSLSSDEPQTPVHLWKGPSRWDKGLPLSHRLDDAIAVAKIHPPLYRTGEDHTEHLLTLLFHCARNSQAVI